MLSFLLAASVALQPPAHGLGKEIQQPDSHPKAKTDESAQSERGTEARPFVVSIPLSEKAQKDSQAKEERENKGAHDERVLTVATVVLTGATVILAVFTFLLWFYTRLAIKDARVATEKSLRTAERAIFEQNRPWVFVQRFTVTSGKSEMVIKNFGRSPALQLAKKIDGHLLPYPFPACPLPVIDHDFTTMLPPDSIEVLTSEVKTDTPPGFQYFIRIGLSYRLQNGESDTLYVDYALKDMFVRKVSPKDFAAHHSTNAYTIGESYPISD